MKSRILRTGFAVLLAVSLLVAGGGAASADGKDFNVGSGCTIRVSGFQDWGKAAASTRDQSGGCALIKTGMHYGGLFYGWYTESGWTASDYIKITAGIYDWKAAHGVSTTGDGIWRAICSSNYC